METLCLMQKNRYETATLSAIGAKQKEMAKVWRLKIWFMRQLSLAYIVLQILHFQLEQIGSRSCTS